MRRFWFLVWLRVYLALGRYLTAHGVIRQAVGTYPMGTSNQRLAIQYPTKAAPRFRVESGGALLYSGEDFSLAKAAYFAAGNPARWLDRDTVVRSR